MWVREREAGQALCSHSVLVEVEDVTRMNLKVSK